MYWLQLLPSLKSRIDAWSQPDAKLSTCVHICGLLAYFTPVTLHAFMIILRRKKFEIVAGFFKVSKQPSSRPPLQLTRTTDEFWYIFFSQDCSYSWYKNYISHTGLSILTVTVYLSVCVLSSAEGLSEGSIALSRVGKNLHMHYVYCMDFLITMQLSTLAHRLAMEFARAKARMRRGDVDAGIQDGDGAFRVAKVTAAIYGPQMVVRVMQSLITLMTFAYGTITNTSPHSRRNFFEIAINVMILTIIVEELWCLCGSCHEAYLS
ncbi:unnamed protein product, partial [Nesidiocoris tenuis]